MDYQSVFSRHEIKYVLDRSQMRRVRDAVADRTVPDEYGENTVRNIYYDTSDYLLASRSIGNPEYKEKLRIRKYSDSAEDPVFVEIKKKYDSVTYKRRLALPKDDALAWLDGSEVDGTDSQIGREIESFRDRYGTLRPAMMLCYRRESFRCADGSDLRMTFDSDVTARLDRLDIDGSTDGAPLIPEGGGIMELKTGTAVPLWLARELSEDGIYKSSFSKYGRAYKLLVLGACRAAPHSVRARARARTENILLGRPDDGVLSAPPDTGACPEKPSGRPPSQPWRCSWPSASRPPPPRLRDRTVRATCRTRWSSSRRTTAAR